MNRLFCGALLVALVCCPGTAYAPKGNFALAAGSAAFQALPKEAVTVAAAASAAGPEPESGGSWEAPVALATGAVTCGLIMYAGTRADKRLKTGFQSLSCFHEDEALYQDLELEDDEDVLSNADSADDDAQDDSMECAACESVEGPSNSSNCKQLGAGKLWATRTAFPEGYKGGFNYDMANLQAARNWTCPCPQGTCLQRVDTLKLYEYRKKFQTTHKQKELRDACREEGEAHYSSDAGFSNTFAIGNVHDACFPAAGLAMGLSFGTFSRARADITLGRPRIAGRLSVKRELRSREIETMDAWIRKTRGGMEGAKSTDAPGTWHWEALRGTPLQRLRH